MEKKWKQWIMAMRHRENKKTGEGLHWEKIGLPRLVILFLAGILLLLLSIPSGKVSEKKDTKKKSPAQEKQEACQDSLTQMREYASQQEKELAKVLSQVEGIGEVEVMITVASSEEKETLQQENSSSDNTQEKDSAGGSRNQSASSIQKEPVVLGDGESEAPYVVQVQSPQIEGVLVVAQGAGSGAADAEIIAAVEALFPIESHKIKVMKMDRKDGLK